MLCPTTSTTGTRSRRLLAASAAALATALAVAACGGDGSRPPLPLPTAPKVVVASRGSSGGGTSAPPPTTSGAVTVASVTVSPSIVVAGASSAAGYVVGGTSGVGSVTLSAASATPTDVALSSDNSFVMPVPSLVTVAAGQRSATFPVGSIPVTGTFTLNVSAGVASITAASRVYVVPTAGTDIITIPRLDLSPKQTTPPLLGEVKIEATSTNPSAVLTAYYAGTPVATLTNNGGGRYSATFTVPTLDTDIEVRSQFGGCGVKATNRPTPSRSCPSL